MLIRFPCFQRIVCMMKIMMKCLKAFEGRKLGLWIDLTRADSYYHDEEVKKRGCIYHKIPLFGHDTSPTREETARFVRLVQNFTRNHPGEIVGVHCTHGLDRTGFLIVAYMAIAMKWIVASMVLTFAKASPCGIYKQDYLVAMFESYGNANECLEAPKEPSWEYSDAVGYDDSSEASTSVSHENTEGTERSEAGN
ncbi:hypothetical protein KIN20_008653 [Parelaphostrongylus tenuis]|uniref:Tyrosine specific protein phosphatases domain-containing protein n=1 Tax=Parelaphostrongylus tenuis TaxID=148309 RepID=A0AAD5M527_PARTN|nr:hypothetical protein KIN20_008653 [Parelaphostrongylus tenuis]